MAVTLLMLAIAGQAAAPAAPAATPQARFDAASKAAAEGRCAEALRGFATLDGTRNALLAAAIDVRRGRCLIELDRAAEGEAAIARGLPVLTAKGEAFAGDVYEAQMALGRLAMRAFDYDAAVRAFTASAALTRDAARIPPLLRMAQATMFDHDGRALAASDEALRLVRATPDMNAKSVAAVQTVRARVLLNEGRTKEAYAILKDSLAKQGGLTNRVGASDLATRSDLAIAALKDGDREGARRYLAFTGAGRVDNTPFTATTPTIEPPTCGDGGLTQADEAIVEFSLEEDGHVSGVAPIYTNGGREKAIAFARAVTGWSWRADDVKKVPPLFRYTTRVELRCIVGDRAPELTKPLSDATDAWLAEKGAGTPPWAELPAAVALPMQRAALAAATTAGDRAHQAQAALALGGNSVIPVAEKPALYATARAALAPLGAPVPVRSYVAIQDGDDSYDRIDAERRRWRALLAQPDVARDALSAATLRLLIAQPRGPKRPPADADALLRAVADEPALPAQHPLKVAALLGQANLLAANGDLPGARAVFDRTGLTGEQCAMLGLQPAVKRMGFGASSYPDEAIRMGFEGWVRTAYDIAADGRTAAPRVVVAYPPFVFDEAASGIIRDTRYTSTFRPEGALACSGEQQTIRFVLP